MDRIIVSGTLADELDRQERSVELHDTNGRLLGFFAPGVGHADYEGVDSPLSEEEIERRSREPDGRSLAEIMADLEKRK